MSREVNSEVERIWGNWQKGTGPCHRCPNRDENKRWQPAMSGGGPQADVAFVALEPASGGKRKQKNHPSKNHHKPVPRVYSKADYWSEEYLERKSEEAFIKFLGDVANHAGFDLAEIYFTNVKKRHNIENGGCSELDPDTANREAREKCKAYLKPELDSVEPSVIVPVGVEAVKAVRRYVGSYIPSTLKKSALTVTGNSPSIIPSYHWSMNARRTALSNLPQENWAMYKEELGAMINAELENQGKD